MGLGLVAAALFVASLGVGSAPLVPAAVLAALAGGGDEAARIIVQDIRLPRALLAVIVGATLGISGAALQGLVRNPLASPSLFGAPSMAALVVSGVLAFGGSGALSFWLPVYGILGALASVAALVLIAGRAAGTITLILAGLALGNLAAAATALVLNLSPNPFAALEIVFWLLGSLEDRSMRHVALVAPFAAVAVAAIRWRARDLRALTLGEDTARSLGVNVTLVRWVTVMAVAVGVGASVSVTGTIGFIGLVAPHLVRASVGHDPARTLLPAALAGASLLLAADIGVRLIPSQNELKVGVLTALIGVPFFLWIVWRSRRTELAAW